MAIMSREELDASMAEKAAQTLQLINADLSGQGHTSPEVEAYVADQKERQKPAEHLPAES